MDNADFEATVEHWQAMPDDHEGIYRTTMGDPGNLYDPSGCALDSKLTMLAELFLVADADQRLMLRDTFTDQSDFLEDLNLFARRTTLWMDGAMDERWLLRGLAAVAIENVGVHDNDTYVTLIILRFAAELLGLDFTALVDAIPELQTEALRPHVENATSHDPNHKRYIIQSFGPPHLRNVYF